MRTKTSTTGSAGLLGKALLKRVLLNCGIVSSLLYVGADVVAAGQWEGYSYTSQTVSELMAVGAPTRPLMVSLLTPYAALVIAFGLGVCAANSRTRALHITGASMIGYGILGQVGLLFFPMHLGEAEGAMSGTVHLVFASVLGLFMLSFTGFGSTAHGKRFGLYSMVTMVVLFLFGVWAGLKVAPLGIQLPTPPLGVTERISIFASMLWVVVLAISLLRVGEGQDSATGHSPPY